VRLGTVPPWYLAPASGAICLDGATKITQHYERSSDILEKLVWALGSGSLGGCPLWVKSLIRPWSALLFDGPEI
jgi:hypothetical protein